MRKVLGRLVRRYVDVTGAPLRAMDKERDEDRPIDLDAPSAPRQSPIDLRARREQRDVIDLDDAVEDPNESRRRS